jgi:hypothetical protein
MVNEEQFINGSVVGHQILDQLNGGLNEFEIHSCEKIDEYEEGLAKQSTINNNGTIPADGVLSIKGSQEFIHMIEVSANRTPPENVKPNTNLIRPLHKILNNMYTFKLPIYGQTLTDSEKKTVKDILHLELVSYKDYKKLAKDVIRKCEEGKGTYHLKKPRIQNERGDGYNPVAFHFPISSIKSNDRLFLSCKGQSGRLTDFGSNVNFSRSDTTISNKMVEVLDLEFNEYIEIVNLWIKSYEYMADFNDMTSYQREKFEDYINSVKQRYLQSVSKTEFRKHKQERINEIHNCLSSTPREIDLEI